MAEEKNLGGRPTKYTPDVCDKVLGFMKQGYSIAEICLDLDINRDTFYEWAKKHEEFSDAKKKGTDFSEGWWEKQGRIALRDKEFNSTLWYMNMKNKFKWADRQESKQETTGELIIKWEEPTQD